MGQNCSIKVGHFCVVKTIRKENQKKIEKDRSAVEWKMSACLGAVQAAFFRLRSQFGKPKFETTFKRWKKSLTDEQRAFFKKMTNHRGRDVHNEDILLSVKTSSTSAYLVPGMTVASGPLVGVVPNPIAGKVPLFASAFVTFEKLRLEGDEVHVTCEKYLNLMEDLVEFFKQAE